MFETESEVRLEYMFDEAAEKSDWDSGKVCGVNEVKASQLSDFIYLLI